MGNYGIVRLDLVKGHVNHHDIDAAIENGVLAEINYATGKIVATTDVKKRQVLVASVANLYDSVDESDFRNEVGVMKVRDFTLVEEDVFTTTQFSTAGGRSTFDAVVKGDYAFATVGGEFSVSATAPTGTAQVFRVVEKTVLNGKPALALQVEVA